MFSILLFCALIFLAPPLTHQCSKSSLLRSTKKEIFLGAKAARGVAMEWLVRFASNKFDHVQDNR